MQEVARRATPKTGADLAWLHQEQVVEPLAEGGVRVVGRYAGKVLRAPGLEVLDQWGVYYDSKDTFESLKAWILLPDGSARRAHPKEDVVDGPAISASSLFDDNRERTIRLRGLVVGAVAAFEHSVVYGLDSGARRMLFGDPERPTAYARFELRVPKDFSFTDVPLRVGEPEIVRSERGFVYTMTGLSPMPREEQRPPAGELLPSVWARWWTEDGTRGFRDWDAVGHWFEKLTADTLHDQGEARDLSSRLRPASEAELLTSLSSAFDFTSREVRYVSIQIGIGGYKPHTPASVCHTRYGDCKDKAFLLRALAEGWGVRTFPVIVQTRDEGRLEESVPSPQQFNHCIAAIALPDGVGEGLWAVAHVEGIGRVLFLDATATGGSAWHLPAMDQGTTALLVHPQGAKLVRLPEQPASSDVARRKLTARLDDQGSIVEGSLEESWSGGRAAHLRNRFARWSNEEHRRRVLERMQHRFPGVAITEYALQALDRKEEPLLQTVRIAGGRLGKRVANLMLIEPGRLAEDIVAVDLPPPPRPWSLEIGPPCEEHLEAVVELPPGWVVEELPAPMRVAAEEFEVDSSWVAEDRTITYRRTARRLASRVTPERYDAFRQAVHALASDATRALVLVRP